ncbi:CGNR zinc finger domain-containing protein [Nakamurella antarctica]|uniref:CGNR zinc finger domain-containing protein n=1 Tax=Nakamurella antarctica TaxID=1902245 RepID=A0A3G8ZLT2_9ACTN|nr:CGNR zinc finger domain-containing protein [Nakamurella antarctica]AZI58223.1 CGNR zinc finger domain-containing protein [Nakamurella antarctica]
MQFAPDTIDVLDFDVAFCNTDPAGSKSGLDELTSAAQLQELVRIHRYTGRIDCDDRELADVARVRDEIRVLWAMERDVLATRINKILAAVTFLPQLARHDGLDWHLHATGSDAPLAERIRVEAALAFIDVIRADATDRLRICAASDCAGLLVDLSRNSSKRFCSVRCSNRVNMIAYRERQSAP